MPRYLRGTIIHMSDFATKKDVKEIVNKAVEDLSEVIDQLAQNMHNELVVVKEDIKDVKTGLNIKLESFETKVNDRFNKIEVNLDRLINTVDGFVKRLDDQEVENKARDAQFARLVDWARKVSVKTGVPLENL